MEEDIKNLSEIIELCEEEINNNDENVSAILDLTDLKSLRNLIKEYKNLKEIEESHRKENGELREKVKELEEENKKLKASHIVTHNKISDEEKAKIFDVIDNSIDTYFEKSKPYWEQIMTKDKMSLEEAEIIINDMYQDRNKILENNNVIDISRLDDVKFTNLEFASVRAIREIQSLERKLDNSIPIYLVEETIEELKPIINKYEKQIENDEETDLSYEEIRNYSCRIQVLQELLEKR